MTWDFNVRHCLRWHTQKYYILVLTNVVLHFIVGFAVLNEINVCVGALETPINKCSLLFIINIKAS